MVGVKAQHIFHWRVTIVIFLIFALISAYIYRNLFYVITWPFLLIGLIGSVRLFIWGADEHYDTSFRDTEYMQKGDILLIGQKDVKVEWPMQMSNVLSHPIKDRFWTRCAIYMGDGKILEALPEGIVEKALSEYFLNGNLVRVFRHRMINNEKIMRMVLGFGIRKQPVPIGYDWPGMAYYAIATITPVGMNLLFDNPFLDRLCRIEMAYSGAELVVDAFKDAGYPLTSYDGWRVKPADFIGNPLLEEIKPMRAESIALGLGDDMPFSL